MKLISYKSDGLGGFFGVTNSIKLGTRKHLSYYKTNILLFFILLSGISQPDSSITTQVSLILTLQRSDEAYKNMKPHTFLKYSLQSSCPGYITYFFYLVTLKRTRVQIPSITSTTQAVHPLPFFLNHYHVISASFIWTFKVLYPKSTSSEVKPKHTTFLFSLRVG